MIIGGHLIEWAVFFPLLLIVLFKNATEAGVALSLLRENKTDEARQYILSLLSKRKVIVSDTIWERTPIGLVARSGKRQAVIADNGNLNLSIEGLEPMLVECFNSDAAKKAGENFIGGPQ